MKELFRGESTKSLKAVVLKCPNAELFLLPLKQDGKYAYNVTLNCVIIFNSEFLSDCPAI
jgi:hypothetical protein